MSEKALEQRLRYAITKMGYQPQKSRARNWTCNDQQGYRIIGPFGIESGECFDLTLEDVKAFVES